MSCIYDYYVFYLGLKAINNFFFKVMFKFIRRVYTFEEIEHWIFIIRIAMYGTFIPSFEHPPIYIKEGVTLKRC